MESSTTAPRRSERRLVRPFPTSDFLGHAEISLTAEDTPFLSGPTIKPELVASIDRSQIAPVLRLPDLPDDFFDTVELGPNDLEVVVWLEDGTLFETHVVARCPFSKYRAGDFSIVEFGDDEECLRPVLAMDAFERLSWADGTEIGIAIVLREQRPRVAGTAWRKGTEIARKSFKFQRPPESGNRPPIEYLDEDGFERRRLHRKTMWHIENTLDEGQVLDEWNLDDSPIRILMAEGLANAIAQNPRAPLNAALQKMVLIDFIVEALVAARDSLEKKPPQKSILDRVLRLVEKECGIKPERLVDIARIDDGRTLRSHLQGGMGVSAQYIQALMGVKA